MILNKTVSFAIEVIKIENAIPIDGYKELHEWLYSFIPVGCGKYFERFEHSNFDDNSESYSDITFEIIPKN